MWKVLFQMQAASLEAAQINFFTLLTISVHFLCSSTFVATGELELPTPATVFPEDSDPFQIILAIAWILTWFSFVLPQQLQSFHQYIEVLNPF